MSQLRYDGKVAIVTGAGQGLGKEYALYFAARGAKVVVNDLGGSVKGEGGSKVADEVVKEIRAAGGHAVANYDSVEYGGNIVRTAMENYGRVDILILNAGILRDLSMIKMTEKDWDLIMAVHLRGSFTVVKHAWSIMREQGYGRIITTTSAAGLYGNFGQVNYSAAKAGLLGFTTAVAKEGEKRNIRINCIAPMAATRMTETVFPKDALEALAPKNVIPLVGYLVHDTCMETGGWFEIGAGWAAKCRVQRSEGHSFDLPFTAEDVAKNFDKICDFTKENEYPQSPSDSLPHMFQNYERNKELKHHKSDAQNLKSAKLLELAETYLARGEGVDAVKKCQALYQFDVLQKKGGPIVASWTMDLRSGNGSIKLGKAEKPECTFTMTDDDVHAIFSGTLNPQNAFLQGKMKIKGDMKKATLFTPDLFPAPTPENIAKYSKPKL